MFKNFVHFITQGAIVFDQLVNWFLSMFFPRAWAGTWADETLSCRAYRMWRDGKPWGKFWMPIIDFLFKWQKLPPNAIGHCHGAYIKEKAKYNLPPDMREDKDK